MLAGVGDCGFFVEQSFLDLLSITEGLFLPLQMLLLEAPINILTFIIQSQFIFKISFVDHAGVLSVVAMESKDHTMNNERLLPITNVLAKVNAERAAWENTTRIVR